MNKRNAFFITLTSAILVTLPTTVFSHITLIDKHAKAGDTIKNALQIGHGCTNWNGKSLATQRVIMLVPDGVKQARAFAKAGWKIKMIKGPITPYESRGTMITEDVVKIIWTADGNNNKLDSDLRGEFYFRATMPEKAAQSIYFPSTQVCNAKNMVEWTGIPMTDQEPGDLDRPAPRLVTTPSGL